MKKFCFLFLAVLLIGCGGGGGGGGDATNGSTPIVTTLVATSITPTSAILNGTAIPNGLQSQSWFECGTDSALATFTSSPKQDAGNGLTSQAANMTWNGLVAGTTYYFRFCSENSKGYSKGIIISFTTSSPGSLPTVSTLAASSVAATSATLNGNVTPNGLATMAWFEWGTNPTLASYASTQAQSLGSGTTSQLVSVALPGLSTGMTYYCRVAASNSSGTSKGTIVSFPPGGSHPTVTTLAATLVAATSATLNGNVMPNGLATSAWFEWGTDAELATYHTTLEQSVGSGTTDQLVSAALPGLSTGTTYYYRIAANNAPGTSKGTIMSFTPGAPPTVTTLAASSVAATSATLNGNVAPNGLATTTWFEWGTDATLATYSTTLEQPVGSGTTSVAVNTALPGLSIGTTYYYRLAASNSSITSKGAIVSFIPGEAPKVTTLAATSVLASNATLNGTVTPNGLATTAWFEWGTDAALATYGMTLAQPVGSGTTSVAVNTALPGLSIGTTYYYRVAANNTSGTSRGMIVSFMPTAAPSVTTLTTTLVVTTSGTFNGNVTPNGLATSAWFEWGTDPVLGTFSSTAIQNIGSGTAGISVNYNLTGLIGGTTYYYRVVAQNSAGTSRGSILNLTTAIPYTVSGKVISNIDIPNWSNMIPTIESCGSCHTNVNWVTGAGHVAGPQSNTTCSACHGPGGMIDTVTAHAAVPSVTGVTITLIGVIYSDVTTTDSVGNYIINNVPNGSYKITPSMNRYNFTPQSVDIIINNDNYIVSDFYKTL